MNADEVAKRLDQWYRRGEDGLSKIRNRPDCPPQIALAIERWYTNGWSNLHKHLREVRDLDSTSK